MKLYLYINIYIYIYIYIVFEVKFILICECLNPMTGVHSFFIIIFSFCLSYFSLTPKKLIKTSHIHLTQFLILNFCTHLFSFTIIGSDFSYILILSFLKVIEKTNRFILCSFSKFIS